MILVHGGAGAELTWEMQDQLAARWTLVIPWRRGFGPSPPAERQDFEVDAGVDRGALERREVERVTRGLRFPGEATPDVDPIIRGRIAVMTMLAYLLTTLE